MFFNPKQNRHPEYVYLPAANEGTPKKMRGPFKPSFGIRIRALGREASDHLLRRVTAPA
jgi:hypothetical protein